MVSPCHTTTRPKLIFLSLVFFNATFRLIAILTSLNDYAFFSPNGDFITKNIVFPCLKSAEKENRYILKCKISNKKSDYETI